MLLDYRLVTDTGEALDLSASSDADAIATAERLHAGRCRELWSRQRLVKRWELIAAPLPPTPN